jgi:hypothetical protein
MTGIFFGNYLMIVREIYCTTIDVDTYMNLCLRGMLDAFLVYIWIKPINYPPPSPNN